MCVSCSSTPFSLLCCFKVQLIHSHELCEMKTHLHMGGKWLGPMHALLYKSEVVYPVDLSLIGGLSFLNSEWCADLLVRILRNIPRGMVFPVVDPIHFQSLLLFSNT